MDIRLNSVSNIYNTNKVGTNKKIDKTKAVEGNTSVFEVSTSFKEYQVAKKAAASTSDIREDRVAEIQAKYNSGKYNVNIEELANKIVGNV